jgi:hypothetical protein
MSSLDLKREGCTMIGTGGTAPKLAATHTVALYDPIDGRVVHMHHVVVFEGGKAVTAQQAENEAVEKAHRRGHPVDRLERLSLAGPAPRVGGRFRVDLASRTLVALDHPARRRSK